jgi:hypothetical protein
MRARRNLRTTLFRWSMPVVCETGWQAMWAQKFKLRTLNALHLASTLTFQADSGPTIPFITADVNQRKAADTFAINMIWVEGAIVHG